MSVDEQDVALEEPVKPPEPAAEDWRENKDGKQYVPRHGKSGVIYRQGDETIEQARARDAQPRDKRPRRRSKTPPKPDAPRQLELKDIEHSLAEALKSPAMACAMLGDEWAANHFTDKGAYLARNLVHAAETNPWLRKKLEELATGGDAAMKVMGVLTLSGAIALYIVPPLVYFTNVPFPERGRIMLEIPHRKAERPAYAAASPNPPAPEPVPVPA